jgi:3-methyladenine DNA glycosylase AlkD
MAHRAAANNWDLVDTVAPGVIGLHLVTRSRRPLMALAASPDRWEKRMAIVATIPLIRERQYADTLVIAERFLASEDDLLHKATGWMLREVGKRDAAVLRGFLRAHAPRMPRTMLRAAIERFPDAERQAWLRVSKAAARDGGEMPREAVPAVSRHGALLSRVAKR